MPEISSNYASLSSDELTALREGKFELHCLKMRLEQMKQGGLVFTGPGLIKQSPNGQLHFTLYAQEIIDADLIFQDFADAMSVQPGTIVPETKFYKLNVVDLKDREWVSTRIDPDTDVHDEGTICSGTITEMVYVATHKRDGDFLYLEFFHDVKIPFNNKTITSKSVAGNESKSAHLDVLKFEAIGMTITARKEQDNLILTVVSKEHQFSPNFETHIVEGLQFVLARPINWSTMIKTSNGKRHIVIRSRQADHLKYRINPPIWIDLSNTEWFILLFTYYLRYILKYSHKDKIHPISAQIRAVGISGAGAVETRSLILCVAIESILAHVIDIENNISAEYEEWVGRVQEFLADWGGPEHLTKRLKGSIDRLHEVSATSRLLQLSKQGIVSRDQIQAWKRLRNKLAHGGALSANSLQKFLNLYHIVLGLFYSIIFHAIEYNGKYSDYSVPGWPMRDYPNQKPAIDTPEEESDATAG